MKFGVKLLSSPVFGKVLPFLADGGRVERVVPGTLTVVVLAASVVVGSPVVVATITVVAATKVGKSLKKS